MHKNKTLRNINNWKIMKKIFLMNFESIFRFAAQAVMFHTSQNIYYHTLSRTTARTARIVLPEFHVVITFSIVSHCQQFHKHEEFSHIFLAGKSWAMHAHMLMQKSAIHIQQLEENIRRDCSRLIFINSQQLTLAKFSIINIK